MVYYELMEFHMEPGSFHSFINNPLYSLNMVRKGKLWRPLIVSYLGKAACIKPLKRSIIIWWFRKRTFCLSWWLYELLGRRFVHCLKLNSIIRRPVTEFQDNITLNWHWSSYFRISLIHLLKELRRTGFNVQLPR